MAKQANGTGPNILGSEHLDNLTLNVVEVDRLLSLHPAEQKARRGRHHHVEVINKSCIVLLCACWEAFVEDTAAAALAEMLRFGSDYRIFPDKVLERVASNLQGPKAWALAGDGWRKAMEDNLQSVLAKTTQALNTPKTDNVNELFSRTIGLDNVSRSWRWRGTGLLAAKTRLDAMVTLRHEIAHRVAGSRTVTLNDARQARELVFRLSTLTNNAVFDFLEARLLGDEWRARSTWVRARYRWSR